MKKTEEERTAIPNQPFTFQAAKCPDCQVALEKISYTIWGTKKFDPITGTYLEDESWGSSDMELLCRNCSAKLEPDGLIL
jgi:hypothetical protein